MNGNQNNNTPNFNNGGSQQPYQQGQNYPQQNWQQQPPQKGMDKSTVIGLCVSIVAIALITIGYFGFFYKGNKKDVIQFGSEITEQTVSDESSVEAESSAPAEEPLKTYTNDFQFSGTPIPNRVGEELAREALSGRFLSTHNDMTAANFSNELSRFTCAGQQLKTDWNGYRYQLFFSGSPYTSSSALTGFAISCEMSGSGSTVTQEVADFESAMREGGAEQQGNNFITRYGCYASAGYFGSRFYIYYYFPNAPHKDAAPRH